jgi:cytochrome c oxidase subunit 2
MTGEVVVMEPADYQAWLNGQMQDMSLAAGGAKLFNDLACNTCHRPDSAGRGPVLDGLVGSRVKLQDGTSAVADEAYVRESILNPSAKIVDGYQPIMPTFQGLISEEGLVQLLEYLKSLKALPPVETKEP